MVGAYGNLINRTLVFVQKHLDGVIPEGRADKDLILHYEQLYELVGACIDQGKLKEALEIIFEEVRAANKYFDTNAPWVTRTTDLNQCKHTIYQCIFRIANLATLLAPYLPFSSERVRQWLTFDLTWKVKHIKSNQLLPAIEILFERIDPKQIEVEREKLRS